MDRAFNVDKKLLGIPLGTGYEFFAPTHTGKSTFTYSLASRIALHENMGWALCDLEAFDAKFLLDIAEFQGMTEDSEIQVCDGSSAKKDFAHSNDETLLDELLEYLKLEGDKKRFAVGILDSVAAISPISEAEGEIGEANMGRRAKIMAQFTRKAIKVFRLENAPTLLAVNHYYPAMGSKQYITPGGEVKNYMFTVRVRLQQLKRDRYEDGSYVLRGFVIKNRWGGGRDENEFEVFVQSGYGIHTGMTAVLDAISLGIATRKSTIKLGEKSWRWKELREGWRDPEIYQPFIDALSEYNQENK